MANRHDNNDLQYHTVERTMRRTKQTNLPAPPKKVEDIAASFENPIVNQVYGMTENKTNTEKNQFYRTTFVCDDFSYSLFAS